MHETYALRTMPAEPPRVSPNRDAIRRDRSLVRRMLAGDERAFDEFADEYTKALFRFAMSRLDGDRELALDVAQTALCKALAKIETYRGDATLFTWLCSVCRNEIFTHFRSRKSAPEETPLDDNVTPIASWEQGRVLPDQALLRGETAAAVHIVLDLLPGHYAEALEWKYLDRLSVKEIGRRLEVGTKAAESILTRARKAFREGYQRVVGESVSPGLSGSDASGGDE